MVAHIDTLNATGLNEMLFIGQTGARVHAKTRVLVAGAYWHNLVNTNERSAVPGKRQQRVRVRMPQRLSLFSLLWCHIKLSPIKIRLRCGLSSKFFDPVITPHRSTS